MAFGVKSRVKNGSARSRCRKRPPARRGGGRTCRYGGTRRWATWREEILILLSVSTDNNCCCAVMPEESILRPSRPKIVLQHPQPTPVVAATKLPPRPSLHVLRHSARACWIGTRFLKNATLYNNTTRRAPRRVFDRLRLCALNRDCEAFHSAGSSNLV